MDADTPEFLLQLQEARDGDPAVLGALFQRHERRLRAMVQLRIDRRLKGRVNPSDVLQEAFLEVSRSLPAYLEKPVLPFFLWIRLLTGRKLHALHRHHLGAQVRDAGREVSLHGGEFPEASSIFIADQLVDRHSSTTHTVARAEIRVRVEEALNGMSELDREVLALRHYEQLTNGEIAQVLGISEAAASVRYIRALERLRPSLAGLENS